MTTILNAGCGFGVLPQSFVQRDGPAGWVLPRAAFYDYLQALVRAGLGKRVMFGSDQMRWPEKIGEAIEAIEQAPFLTEEQKRDILYHNAVRFLRLEQDASRARPPKEE